MSPKKTIKEAARSHWKEYCGTLNRTTNLSLVWQMAKKMNGIDPHQKPPNSEYNDELVETNLEKANIFAESFARISYTRLFQIHKQEQEKKEDEIATSAVL